MRFLTRILVFVQVVTLSLSSVQSNIIDWSVVSESLPSDHIRGISAIYNNEFFVFGQSDSGNFNLDGNSNISIISLNNINLDNNNSNNNKSSWQQNNWHYNRTLMQTSHSYSISNAASSVQIDSLLYMTSQSLYFMLIYDLSSHKQIDPSTYSYGMPNYDYTDSDDTYLYDTCTVTNNTHIFVIGGREASSTVKTLYIYDIMNDKWITDGVAAMEQDVSGTACEYYDDDSSDIDDNSDGSAIYVFGGLQTGTWGS